LALWRYLDVAFVRAALLAGFRHPSGSNVYPGKRVKESKNIQDPQNHGNDHDAVTYLFMFTLMLIEIITGLTLYTQVRGKWALGWLFGWIPGVIDIQHIRLLHFCIMFAFFAFVIHHVYSAVLVSWEERNGLIESIFTGYKFVPMSELEEEEEDAVLSKAD